MFRLQHNYMPLELEKPSLELDDKIEIGNHLMLGTNKVKIIEVVDDKTVKVRDLDKSVEFERIIGKEYTANISDLYPLPYHRFYFLGHPVVPYEEESDWEFIQKIKEFLENNPKDGMYYKAKDLGIDSVLFTPDAMIAIDVTNVAPAFLVYMNPPYTKKRQ